MTRDALATLLARLAAPGGGGPVGGVGGVAGVDAADALAAPPAGDAEGGARQKCSFDLPAELAHAFRAVCAIQGVKQRRVVERLVAAYVARHTAARAA